jgi:serine palmitoyltransferase
VIRAALGPVEAITIVPSHAISQIIDIHQSSAMPSSFLTLEAQNPANPALREVPLFDFSREERVRPDIVDEVLAQGMRITRARRLRRQELVEARPSIRLAVTAVLSLKECEPVAEDINAVAVKEHAKRR